MVESSPEGQKLCTFSPCLSALMKATLNRVAFCLCIIYRVWKKSVYRCRPVSVIALSLSALCVPLIIAACLTSISFCIGLLFWKLPGNASKIVIRVTKQPHFVEFWRVASTLNHLWELLRTTASMLEPFYANFTEWKERRVTVVRGLPDPRI